MRRESSFLMPRGRFSVQCQIGQLFYRRLKGAYLCLVVVMPIVSFERLKVLDGGP